MSERNNYSTSPEYRRGLVLGFTVAEIILLVLFALLLALVGSMISNKAEVEKAFSLNNKFNEAIKALEADDKQNFAEKVKEVINQDIDYQKKLIEIEQKLGKQPLPDNVYAELVANKIDVTTQDGKQKLLDLLIVALTAEKKAKEEGGLKAQDEIISACKSGLELEKAIGDSQTLSDFVDAHKNAKAQADHWKVEASKCGRGGNLPPCYRESAEDPIPFIYEARIYNDGIKLTEIVPANLKDRFDADFKSPPITDTTLTPTELMNSTRQFLQWGEKNECRFYVKIYDEMPNDKEKFKSSLKSIESNFYKSQQW